MRYWSRHRSFTPSCRPKSNITSNPELEHYPQSWARAVSEADDANEVKDSQLEPLSGQVLDEDGARTRAIRPKKTAATNLWAVAA
ncbi:MAG: hypothetical protein EON58_06155 [Alphaproteobacteria bacterium]|nr:MAG: hypothetical protein EON58_06155 [Alphaproteobacteria bacterium]